MGSIITALGGGSGIDMSKLASDLATAQFAMRSDMLAARGEKLERQISAASSLRNSLSLLAGSLGDRVRMSDLSPQPSLGNPSVASASTPVGTRASGSFSLEVLQLARGQSLASPALASAGDPVGSGTLTLRFGEISGGAFTANADRPAVDIAIASGATLADIASAINQAGAGVTAYVAETGAGARLMLKGEDGAANGFILEATEIPGDEGLAQLAWEPGTGDLSALTGSAQDAVYKLDGLERTSASNDLGQVAPGLALKLSGTNAGAPTTIGFSDPSASIASAMQDLVSAFNEVASALNAAMDPLSGELASDSGARSLRNSLSRLASQIVMPNASGDAPRTLSDLGLAIERDGTFRLDTARLEATLERDPQGVAAMFTNGLYGVYATVDKLARDVSSSSNPGSLAGSVARYQRQSKDISEDAADMVQKQETLRQSLVARFAKADVRIAASQSTLSFLQSQIDAWNSSRD